MNWTQRDEEKWRALLSQQDALAVKREAACIRVTAAFADLPEDDAAVPEWAIRNADRIRDALAPFDSGVRATEG